MSEGLQERLGAGAALLVEAASSRPRLVVFLCALLTAGSVYAAATILTVDTDSDRILSPDMPVRQTNLALEAAFPEMQHNLIVMVDADEDGDARDAAEELAARLRDQPDRYLGVFLPGDAPYYEDFGLFHLDREDLDEIAERIDNAGPFLATLVERPELPILLGSLSHVVNVDGLSVLGDDGSRILSHIALAVERFNEGGGAPIVWEDVVFEDLGIEQDNPQLLFVRPAGDLTQLGPVLESIQHIRALAGELAPLPGLRVRVTGDRAVHSEEMSLVIVEAIMAGCLSLLLVTVILFLCLRSWRLVLTTVVTLLVGLTWTAGVAALSVGQLNALTSAFAVVYVGLAVDFGIHFGLGYLEQRRMGSPVPLALVACGRSVGSSLILCGITTAIGFYAFIPTPYTGVAEMGIISGTGILLGLLATLTLYPALIALGLAESSRPERTRPRRFELRLPSFPISHPTAVCGIAVGVALVSAAALPWLRFDVNTLNVRDPRVESVQALKDLLTDPERSAWTIDVLTQDLDEARDVARRLETLKGVEQVNTLASFVPDDQAERLAIFEQMRSDLKSPVELTDDESGEGLDRLKAVEFTIEGYGVALDLDEELRMGEGDDDPAVQEAERLRDAFFVLHRRLDNEAEPPDLDALEEDLFGDLSDLLDDLIESLPARTVTLEDLPEELSQRYLSADGRARVEVFAAGDITAPGALEQFSDLIHSVRPDAGGPAAGTVALGRAIVDSLQQALATALAVITLLLLTLTRSIKDTLITLTPLGVGGIATAATTVFADIPFNFANIIVLPLILGIGVDSGIHLVRRYRMGIRGAGNLLSTSTANAVLFSALTTGASFATLAFSNHLGISSLAELLTVGVALMLVANVTVLPSVLTLVGGDARDGAKDRS